MDKKKIEAVIFDFDGLIVDSEPIYVDSNIKFLSERGITDYSILNRIFGMRAEETFQLMKDELKLEGSVEELMNIRNQYILDDFEAGKLKTRPHLFETLDILKDKFTLAIGSSSKRVLLEKGVEIHKLEKYFSLVVCGDDVTRGKPEPDIYLEVSKRLNISPDKCIVLEDAPLGIVAAKRAGMTAIAIPNEQTKDLDFNNPDYKVETLKDVPSIIM